MFSTYHMAAMPGQCQGLSNMPKRSMPKAFRLSSFRLRFSPALGRALGLFVVSSIVRGLGAIAALALAAHIGTSAAMDHYMAFTMVLSSACALLASPLPVVVTKRLAEGPSLAVTAQVCRKWAKQIQRVALVLYTLACPILAWLFTPVGASGFTDLLILLLMGLPAALVCSQLATEQALLQARGYPFKAMWSAALSSGTGLAAAAVCGWFGGIYLAALGVALGSCLELLWLRRVNRVIEKPVAPVAVEPFPWATMLTVLGASSGILLQSFYDQSLLAQMGTGAQANWGLATRIPSFLNMSLAGMAGVLCSATLTQAKLEGRLQNESLRLCGLVGFLSLVVMGVVWVAAEPITRVLYERGAFTPTDTKQVAEVLRWIVLAYITYPVTSVIIRALGLIGGHRTMLLSAVMFIIVKVMLTTLLLSSLGVGALTVATLAAGLAQIAVLGWRFFVAKTQPAIDQT